MSADLVSLPAGAPWTETLVARFAADDAPVWVYDPDRAAVIWANAAGVARFSAPSLDLLRRRDLHGAGQAPNPARVERARAAFARGEVVFDSSPPDDAPTLMVPVVLEDDRAAFLCRVVGPARRAPPDHAARHHKLEAEVTLLRSLVDTMSTLILVVDDQGRISRANRAARARLGGASLLDRRIWEACGAPSEAELRAWLRAGEAPPEPFEIGTETVSGRRQILWTARAERDEASGQAHLLLSGVDVTALRQAETRLQTTDRLASMGTLAAGLAHDLNNPLAFVITNAEMVQEELLRRAIDVELEAMIADCLQGARRAAAIVGQLQTFAKGSASGRPGIAHVSSVVEFATRMAHNHARHSARLEVDCPQDLFAAIEESTLGQVVLNLLVRAFDSIPPGHKDQHLVRVVAAPADARFVRLDVVDDGEGLSEEALRRVFDPYRSPSDISSGLLGLGLTISHRLVTEAGGRIEVHSAPERGTSVQVFLPALDRGEAEPDPRAAPEATAPPPRASTPPPAAPVRQAEGARILVVDDEDHLRAVLRRMLRGYRLDGAKNGREALERIRAHRYDLVLCDIMMPEMTGPELYRALEQERPEDAARMVFLSGGAFTPETQAFLDETPCPVVDKPFRIDALRALVAETLARHRPSSG